jgi:hypothetical protein
MFARLVFGCPFWFSLYLNSSLHSFVVEIMGKSSKGKKGKSSKKLDSSKEEKEAVIEVKVEDDNDGVEEVGPPEFQELQGSSVIKNLKLINENLR